MDKIIDFYSDIDRIKHRRREGWMQKGIPGAMDTIASHSFGAALIGWILAREEGIDENKMIKMLLIHDLIMAYVEDLTPSDTSYEKKRELENSAALKLLDDVPLSIKEEFHSLFAEYQEEKSTEAILARECDKLDTLLQSYMYSKKLREGHLPGICRVIQR
jgi:putative hydrolases of HD superfamily